MGGKWESLDVEDSWGRDSIVLRVLVPTNVDSTIIHSQVVLISRLSACAGYLPFPRGFYYDSRVRPLTPNLQIYVQLIGCRNSKSWTV